MKKRSNPPPPPIECKPPAPPSPPLPFGFLVQSKLCSTCIYRPDSTLDIRKLEADVADPKMPGHFKAYRECHHAKRGSKVCCRGFWNAHKDHFDAGQLAQRLDLVCFVSVDVMPESTQRIKQERRNKREKARRDSRSK